MGKWYPWGAVLLMSCALAAAAPPPRSAARADPRKEVATLIEQLPQVAEEVVYASAAYYDLGSSFWPLPYAGSEASRNEMKSTRSAVLHRLVKYGADALPLLLSHLTDRRPAKSSLAAHNASACFGDQYDPRYQDPRKQPRGVNRKEEDRTALPQLPGYTLRVGDLCFSVVGQIVNRHLHAVNARPGYVINSPLERPALARAVKQDWGGVSRAAHQQSLIDDVVHDNRYVWCSTTDALERLCFYYPATAERWVVKLLSRPVDDSERVAQFVQKALLTEENPDHWKRQIACFHAEHGERYGAMVFRELAVGYAVHPVEPEQGGPTPAQRERAQAILRRVYPGRDWYRPPLAPLNTSTHLVNSLRASLPLRSPRVDALVLEIFRSVTTGRGAYVTAQGSDAIALACIDRLAGRSGDAELAAYCRRRIRELEAGKRTPFEEGILQELKEKLRSLPGGPGRRGRAGAAAVVSE